MKQSEISLSQTMPALLARNDKDECLGISAYRNDIPLTQEVRMAGIKALTNAFSRDFKTEEEAVSFFCILDKRVTANKMTRQQFLDSITEIIDGKKKKYGAITVDLVVNQVKVDIPLFTYEDVRECNYNGERKYFSVNFAKDSANRPMWIEAKYITEENAERVLTAGAFAIYKNKILK